MFMEDTVWTIRVLLQGDPSEFRKALETMLQECMTRLRARVKRPSEKDVTELLKVLAQRCEELTQFVREVVEEAAEFTPLLDVFSRVVREGKCRVGYGEALVLSRINFVCAARLEETLFRVHREDRGCINSPLGLQIVMVARLLKGHLGFLG